MSNDPAEMNEGLDSEEQSERRTCSNIEKWLSFTGELSLHSVEPESK